MFKKFFKKDKEVKEEPKKDEAPITSDAPITVEPIGEVSDVVIKASEEHVHDENCKHDHKEEEPQSPPPLTYKEAKALKRSRYGEIANKFNTAYVLQNKKTGQVVEIRAASSFHACNIIGWKPNRVVIIDQKVITKEAQESKEVKREDAVAETTSVASS